MSLMKTWPSWIELELTAPGAMFRLLTAAPAIFDSVTAFSASAAVPTMPAVRFPAMRPAVIVPSTVTLPSTWALPTTCSSALTVMFVNTPLVPWTAPVVTLFGSMSPSTLVATAARIAYGVDTMRCRGRRGRSLLTVISNQTLSESRTSWAITSTDPRITL